MVPGFNRNPCSRPSLCPSPRSLLTAIRLNRYVRFALFTFAIWMFLLSIRTMGEGFQGLGDNFSEELLTTVDNPLAGLFVGLLATSVVQSSSSTTSITVALVGSGSLPIEHAIPVIMGANIGTSVTALIVSLGHIRRDLEYLRATSAALVHDIFNVMAVTLLFPLEIITRRFFGTGLIEFLAVGLSSRFYGTAGQKLGKPLDTILEPPSDLIISSSPEPWIAIILSLIILFISLKIISDSMHLLMDVRIQRILDRYLFRTAASAFFFGVVLTMIIQSSSVTTSLIVPLVGGGILNIEQIFPYTLGANLGTTITAMLAALATNNEDAVTVAFAHMFFNMLGILLIYPFKRIPISLATWMAGFVVEHRNFVIWYIIIVFYAIPTLVVFGPRVLGS